MFVACDPSGNLINILQDQVVDTNLCCPACGRPVRLKSGEVVRAHFAHVQLQQCQFSGENEGPEHLELKAVLYRWAKMEQAVEVESFFPELCQIADVFVYPRLVLEVQCSSLSQKRLKERTLAYQAGDLAVVWLLGEKLWLKSAISSLQKQFLSFSYHAGFFLWELDQKKEVLRLKYLIHEDWHGRVQYKQKLFPFYQENLLSVLRFPYQMQGIESFFAKEDPYLLRYIRQQLYFQHPKWMKFQEKLYLNGENLLEKSLDYFYPQVRPIKSVQGFCQISHDLAPYYQSFEAYYVHQKKKKHQQLYSPAFYMEA